MQIHKLFNQVLFVVKSQLHQKILKQDLYANTQSSQQSFVSGDTTTVSKAPQNNVQVGLGRELGRIKANARGTPYVSERDDSSSHNRPYSSALFAAAIGGNKRPTTDFDIYSGPTIGIQVISPGTSSERVLHGSINLKSASPNLNIDFKPRGLKWNGKDAVSTSQLEQMRTNRKNKSSSSVGTPRSSSSEKLL